MAQKPPTKSRKPPREKFAGLATDPTWLARSERGHLRAMAREIGVSHPTLRRWIDRWHAGTYSADTRRSAQTPRWPQATSPEDELTDEVRTKVVEGLQGLLAIVNGSGLNRSRE